MIDPKISGFKGLNFSNENALGKFIECIGKGTVKKDSVLIVENLDRFSRDKITNCITKFIQIVEAGVSIGIVSMDIIIDLEQLNNQMVWQWVSNEFTRARNESKRKSEFGLDNIRTKVNEAKSGKKVYFGGQTPCWITGVKDNVFTINNDKAGHIKHLFELYNSGMSLVKVAKTLNQEKIKPLEHGKHWYPSSVRNFLTNKCVIGRCKVNDFVNNSYYPIIIEEHIFYSTQARIERNKSNRGGSINNECPNVFKGLVYCKCGGKIHVTTIKHKNKKYTYCSCGNVRLGTCNQFTRWKMKELEYDIFFYLLKKTPEELTIKETIEPNNSITILNVELAKNEAAIKEAGALLGKGIKPSTLEKIFFELERKEIDIKKRIQAEQSKAAVIKDSSKVINKFKAVFNVSDLELIDNTIDAVVDGLANNQTRIELRNIMPELVEKIELDLNGWKYSARLTNGQTINRNELGMEYTKDVQEK